MEKVKIKKNNLGDTRTATRVPTFDEFRDANYSHIEDVRNMMRSVSEEVRSVGANHDFTKTKEPYRSLFYREADGCKGCKHVGLWENEYENGLNCPCLRCSRRTPDNYEPERRTDD